VVTFLLAQAAGGNFLNGMVDDMTVAGQRYEAASYGIGLGLFAVLSLAGAAMYFWRYENEHHSLHGIEAGLFAMLKGIGIPFAIMIAVGQFLPTLTASAMALSGNITGVVVRGPSAIMILGINLAGRVIHQPMAMVQTSLPPPANAGGLGAIIGLNIAPNALALAQHAGPLVVGAIGTVLAALVDVFVIIPSFALITIEYITAIANIAIVLSVGTFTMGWSAAPGTAPIAEKFYGSVNAAAMRLIVIGVTVSFIGATIGLWAAYTATTDLSQMVFALLKVAGGSIVMAGIAVKLPAMAANAMGGSPAVGGSDTVGAGSKAAGGAKQAVNAAKELLKK
jgi:hypothetical protein